MREQSCIYLRPKYIKTIFYRSFAKHVAPGLKGLISGSPATWINSPACNARTCRASKTQRGRAYRAFCDSNLASGGLMTAHEEGLLSSVGLVAERDGRDGEIDARDVKLTPGIVNYRKDRSRAPKGQ